MEENKNYEVVVTNEAVLEDETEYIFITSYTKNGKTYSASDYGKKAFKIKKKY